MPPISPKLWRFVRNSSPIVDCAAAASSVVAPVSAANAVTAALSSSPPLTAIARPALSAPPTAPPMPARRAVPIETL